MSWIIAALMLGTPILAKGAEPNEEITYVNWSFDKCLHELADESDVCNEPQWKSEPVRIYFVEGEMSPAVKIGLDLDGIDSDEKLNYESPALNVEFDVSIRPLDSVDPADYFMMRADDYGSDFETFSDFHGTDYCSLPMKTTWTFDRAYRDAEMSMITVYFVIKGNVECSLLERLKAFLKEYWYLVVAGGVFFVLMCCIACCCCRSGCCCLWDLLLCYADEECSLCDCSICDLLCCLCKDCGCTITCGKGANKAVEMV